MSGDVGPEDQRIENAPMLDRDDEERREVRRGLGMSGISREIAEWLVSADTNVIKELSEVRRAARIYGKKVNKLHRHASVRHIRQ